jgi:hypothetical protein
MPVTVFAGDDELLAFLHLRYHAPITVITPLPSCRLSNIAHTNITTLSVMDHVDGPLLSRSKRKFLSR